MSGWISVLVHTPAHAALGPVGVLVMVVYVLGYPILTFLRVSPHRNGSHPMACDPRSPVSCA